MYKRNVSRRSIRGICKGSICITWSTNKNHIGLRPKVCGSILGGLYGKTRDLNSDFNSILPINKWTNRKTELDVRAVSIILRQLHTKQLGIVTTSCIVCI